MMRQAALLLALFLVAPPAGAQEKLGSVLGRSPGQLLGTAVGALGDLDGDGRGEWMGVRGGPEGARPELLVLAGRDGSVLYDLVGNGEIGLFYLPAQIDARDLDLDGVHDFAFGNSSAGANGMARAGRVAVHSGRTGQRLYVTTGVLSGGAFGASLASIDDLDGDAIPDLVVGQIGSQDENVWLVSGASGAHLRSVHGPRGGDPEYGWAVASTGDMDRDRVPDFAVGTLRAGVVRFYSGASGRLLRTIGGLHSFGRTLADAGDLDGDGAHELLVGETNRRVVWIVAGKSGAMVPVPAVDRVESLSAAGDLDADGLSDFLVGDGAAQDARGVVRAFSSRSRSVLARLTGEHPGDRFGASVAGGADFDLDGLADLVVGAPGVDGPARGGDAGEISIWSLSSPGAMDR